jgi:hypothetical protein
MRTRIVSSILATAAALAMVSLMTVPSVAQEGGKKEGKKKGARPAPPPDPRTSQPVPRLPNGKPDLSGIWDHPRVGDVAADVPMGFCVGGTYGCDSKSSADGKLPFTPFGEAQEKRTDKFDYGVHCLPWGYTRAWGTPYPVEVVQNNNRFAILFEQNNMFHIVPTDGTPLPKDPDETWMGTSVGHWDGDTLVVETIGFNGQTWLDTGKETPTTNQMRVTEKFTRPDFTHLTYVVTIEDPKMYTKPFTNTRTMVLMKPGSQILEYSCDENNKETKEGHITDQWTQKK